MAIFIKKQKADILREALRKLETQTPISAVSPGSVARAFTEAITTELADYYDALDFQVSQSVISTASGRALDLMGDLYDIKRRTVSDIATIDKKMGAFYFYIDSPAPNDIVIPRGTEIYTATDSFVGRQLKFSLEADAVIRAGQKRVFASITPDFGDAMFTASANTLVVHSFVSPPGILVKCINPKAISAQPGYEDDENYRLRIIKSIRVAAGGTNDAIRFAALGIPGVRDVRIQETVYGLGSFRLLVTPEDIDFAVTSASQLLEAVNSVRPTGVRMFLAQPDLQRMDVSVTVITRNLPTGTNREVLIRRITLGIKRYLNSLLAGDTLIYNRLVQTILDVSPEILDVQFTRYAPNGVESLRRNFQPAAEEMLIPGRIEVSIASS